MSRLMMSIIAAAAVSAGAVAQWQLECVLDGSHVVPPVSTSANAVGVFTLNTQSNVVTYFLIAGGLSATGATVRLGNAGQNGVLLFTLAGGPSIWEGQFGPLSSSDVVTMLKQGMYATVTSAAFPSGEIRGQIQPTKKSNFSATLSAAQVVPPAASAATGSSETRLNEPDGVLVYDVKATGIAAGSSATARLGAPGQNGAVLFTLLGASGHWCGVSPFLSPPVVATIKASGLYWQVESAAFPGGEIRGQLVPALAVFSVALDGSQEVPPTGSSASGCGWAEFTPATSSLSFHFTVAGLSSPVTAAHIHSGVTGEAGPIVFPAIGGPTSWTGTAGPLQAAEVDALYRGNLYFNVHTINFSNGEVRGQIRPDPYVFGVGIGTNGPLKIVARGYGPSSGNVVTVSLAGAVANTTSFLFLSASSTFSTALNAPLPILGSPIGNLYTDASLALVIPAPNGPAGCPEVTLTVPADPALACFRGFAQFATIDTTFNVFGFVLTDALELKILP